MPKSPSVSVPYEPAAVISEADQAASQSRGWTAKLVITLAIVMIVGLVLLCIIGPHIPSGE